MGCGLWVLPVTGPPHSSRPACTCSAPAPTLLLVHTCLPPPAQDPTGAIGGTLTRAVLESEPELRQGAVVRLRRVTLLRTPPPRSINHLCITLDSVVQVIPPPGSRQAAMAAVATQQLQQPGGVFPALPAPPTAATRPAASWQQPRQGMPPPPAQQQPAGPGASQSRSFAWPSLGAVPTQPRAPQQLPPPCSASLGWPSLVPGVSQQRQGAQQEQQQEMPPPPARLPAQMGTAHGKQRQQPASPGGSASVGFSLPSFLHPHQHQQASCQDDATSGRNREQAPPSSQVPVQAAGSPQQAQQQGGAAAAGAGWLAGLLAEADFDPFASQQPSQQERVVLAERQPAAPQAQQLSPHGQHATKRQCMGQPFRPQEQQLQQQSSPAGGGAVFAEGIDELDLDDS